MTTAYEYEYMSRISACAVEGESGNRCAIASGIEPDQAARKAGLVEALHPFVECARNNVNEYG